MLGHMVKAQRNRCHYCKELMNGTIGSKRQATREHITPRCRGGVDTYSNMRAACLECNNRRGRIPYHAYLKFCELHGHRLSIRYILRKLSPFDYASHKTLYDTVRQYHHFGPKADDPYGLREQAALFEKSLIPIPVPDTPSPLAVIQRRPFLVGTKRKLQSIVLSIPKRVRDEICASTEGQMP